MSAQNPPVNGAAYTVYVALQDFATPGAYKANPTLAAGDVKVSIDGGAFANLGTLPVVTPAAGVAVKLVLSAAEMTGDNIFVQFIDQTSPKEWADYALNIQTVAGAWNVGKTGYSLSAAGVQAIWDALTSALTTVGSIGKRLADNVDAAISTRSTYAGGAVASVTGNVGGNVVGSVGSVTGAVGSVTGNVGGNVTGSVGSVVGAVGSVTAAVTVGTNNDKTGYALSAAGLAAIWDRLTSALTTVGSIGKLLVDNVDAAISSRLASVSYTAAPTANQNADALLDRADAIETGLTLRQAHRLEAAAAAGKLSGAATATVTIRNAVADSKDRLIATVDSDGNRSAVVADVS